MRKLGLSLVLFTIFIGGGLYLASGVVLSKVTDKVLEIVISHGQTDIFSIKQPSYQKVALSGINSVVWNGISFTAMVAEQKDSQVRRPYRIWCDTVILQAVNFTERTFVITGTGLRAAGDGDGKNGALEKQYGRLEDASFTSIFYLDVFSPAQAITQLKDISLAMKRLVQHGNTDIPVQFEGTVVLPVNNKEVPVRLQIVKDQEQYVLILNKDSLQNLAVAKDEKLTDPEIELFSRNPLKSPKLFSIRDDAKNTAIEARKKDGTVPEDAYRHVFWSYLLTRSFGAEFAQMVTDAHELGMTDNTEAEHRMDYNNNAIGRSYAAKGYQREEILARLRTDSRVIISAR